MKKIIILVVAALMLFLSYGSCFAAEQTVAPVEDSLTPRYEATTSVVPRLVITSGTASYQVRLEPQTSTSISYVDATLKLVNSKGTVIKTKTDRLYLSAGYFKISDSKKLTTKGTYHAEYILKVYKSGKLLETIKGKSNTDTY
ncbi:hypothetical protein [Emergencia timonensis]|uniref:hypothetical protein n=1 Tax=Emergencia timonensis TaxID=1776384 RepID=UPI0039926A0D